MFIIPSLVGAKFSKDAFDPDALSFFARVDAATGISDFLTNTEKSAIDTLVIQMKADGIWTKMKAIYPMVGGGNGTLAQNQAACQQNLVSSSFTGTFSSGWTFASTGVTPNGTSAYMNTNFNQNSNSNLNSTHLSYYSRTTSNLTEVEIGVQFGSDGSLVEIRTSGTTYYRVNSGPSYITYSDSDSKGLYVSNRNASNVINGWKNGIKVANGTTVSSGLPNLNVYVGAYNENSVANYTTTKECAFASIGDGLTDTEASDFYTAVQAFQTTLSRQV